MDAQTSHTALLELEELKLENEDLRNTIRLHQAHAREAKEQLVESEARSQWRNADLEIMVRENRHEIDGLRQQNQYFQVKYEDVQRRYADVQRVSEQREEETRALAAALSATQDELFRASEEASTLEVDNERLTQQKSLIEQENELLKRLMVVTSRFTGAVLKNHGGGGSSVGDSRRLLDDTKEIVEALEEALDQGAVVGA